MKSCFEWLLLVVLALGTAPAVLSADETTKASVMGDRTEEMMGRYNLQPAFEKLGRGIGNLFLGALEIPVTIDKRYQESNTIDSFLSGLAIGAFKGLVRTGVGLYETVTFLLPYPESYAPILHPLPYSDRNKRKQLPLE